MTVSRYLKTYHYTDLALDILGVKEEDLASIENPSLYVIQTLRLMILQCLSQCEELMTTQNEV